MPGREQSLFHYINCPPFGQKETEDPQSKQKTPASVHVVLHRKDNPLQSGPELCIFVLVCPRMELNVHLSK